MIDSELQLFKQDPTTFRLSSVIVIHAVLNNVWPHVSKQQRTDGLTEFEKLFHKVSNDNDETLVDALHPMSVGCIGDSYMLWAPADQREDVKGVWPGTPPTRYYSVVDIKTDVITGTKTVVIECKAAEQTLAFEDGDVIFITSKDNPDSGTGTTEQGVIDGVPVIVSLEVTITLADNLSNGYLVADGSRIYSCPDAADVAATFDNFTDASGIYDDTTYPIILDNIGTVEETITATFADGTNFSVSGDITGAMGSGDKNTDFIWTNPDWTKPGFTIDKDGWEGTPAATNFISFQTHPAAYPMGFKKVTPALSDSITSELHRQEFMGESPT